MHVGKLIPTLIKKNKALYIFASSILFASFVFNIFGANLYPGWFESFDSWSGNLPLSAIQCAQEGKYPGGLTLSPIDEGLGQGPNTCAPYVSQFGLQGYVYSVIPHIAHDSSKIIDHLVTLTKVLLAMLMGLVFLAFIYFVHREFGKREAYIVSALLSLSFWPIGYSNNLYWVAFVMFIPFVFALLAYPKLNQTPKQLWLFYGLLGLLLFIKFLTGYEFISVIVLGVATPVIYWSIVQKASLKSMLIRVALVGITGVIAFCFALGLNIASLKHDFGSYKKAAQAVEARGALRAGNPSQFYPHTVSNFDWTLPTLYSTISRFDSLDKYATGKGNPLVYRAILIINYSFLPLLTIPLQFNSLLMIVLESFILWFIVGLYLLRVLRKKNILNARQLDAVKWSVIISFVGVLSWFVLASGHVYEHAHLDAIIYYLPLALWLYVILAVACNHFVKSTWRPKTK